jgi:CHAD domain-containing protein
MSYRLELERPLPEELRRVAREQLHRAADELATDPAGIDRAVHQARKRCKKVRGLLRLVRAPLGADYQVLNTRLRDIARSMARLRDATALLGVVDDLVASSDDQALQSAAAALHHRLEFQRAALVQDEDLSGLAVDAAADLRALALQVETWPLADDLTIGDLMPGLARTYRRGREAMPVARDGTPDDVHEWRKRCKYLWYQLRLVTPCWPGPLTALAAELSELGSQLGEHHDLANLQQAAADLAESSAVDVDSLRTLNAAIAARFAQILAVTLPRGERIWAEKPKAFTARIQAYWSSASAEAAASPTADGSLAPHPR